MGEDTDGARGEKWPNWESATDVYKRQRIPFFSVSRVWLQGNGVRASGAASALFPVGQLIIGPAHYRSAPAISRRSSVSLASRISYNRRGADGRGALSGSPIRCVAQHPAITTGPSLHLDEGWSVPFGKGDDAWQSPQPWTPSIELCGGRRLGCHRIKRQRVLLGD